MKGKKGCKKFMGMSQDHDWVTCMSLPGPPNTGQIKAYLQTTYSPQPSKLSSFPIHLHIQCA